jgi:flagellar hook assembly protein FlgD
MDAPRAQRAQQWIGCNAAEAGPVTLAIYNTLGQQVRVLVQDNLAAGQYRVKWGGTDMAGREVSSGVYFYRLIHSSGVLTPRLLFVK